MRIQELMTTNVVTCTAQTSCVDAAKLMQSHDVGSLPVIENGKLAGVVTDRDITVRCLALGHDPNRMTVSSCMTKNPVTCSPDTDAHEAARLMAAEQIRRLPVVDKGTLVGVCALGDMATVDIHVNEAGAALSGISEQTQIH